MWLISEYQMSRKKSPSSLRQRLKTQRKQFKSDTLKCCPSMQQLIVALIWLRPKLTKSIKLFMIKQLNWRKWHNSIKVLCIRTNESIMFYVRWCQGNISTRDFTYESVGTGQATDLLPMDRGCANKVSVNCFFKTMTGYLNIKSWLVGESLQGGSGEEE